MLLVLAAFGGVAIPGWTQSANRKSLPGHGLAVIGRLKATGHLPASQRMDFAIGLPLRNRDALTNLLQQLYDPASPNYHRYLTPEKFTAKFGPTEADYRAVMNFAIANRFTVRHTHPNRVLLDVSASVADIEKSLNITMGLYQHPTESRTFHAPDTAPSVESNIPILDIMGLNNYTTPRPAGIRADPHGGRAGPAPAFGTGPGGSYMARDFRTAYVPGVTLTGAGQAVALVEFDSYYASDILAYESANKLPNVSLTNVLFDNVSGQPGYSGIDEGVLEVSLDIEMAMAMAPGLSQVFVYEEDPTTPYLAGVLANIANDNLARQISCSWIWGLGADDPTTDQILQQFAAQGQSYFNSSGDWGAYWDNVDQFAEDQNDAPILTSPYITLVGGTSLVTASPGGTWESEQVWNEAANLNSSGAVSMTYAIPSWQQGVATSANGASTTMRNSPDVALVAENIWVAYNDGQQDDSGGGTSAAAPLWAGFTALVNQQGAAHDQPPVGFLNPAIYAIGFSSNYASCFHDITVGNNTNSYSPSNFFAVPGYDLCSGWGTPAGSNLINALAPPDALQITPTTDFTFAGFTKGPFYIASQTLSLSNSGSAPITWTNGNTSTWLDISPRGGALIPGAAATAVNVSLSAAASNLAEGVYSSTLWFTNLNSGIAFSRHFTLLAGQLVQNGNFATSNCLDWTPFVEVIYDPTAPFLGNVASVESGYCSQTLPTLAAHAYQLSFWMSAQDEVTNVEQFSASWDGNMVFNEESYVAPYVWTNVQRIVKASGSNTLLQFAFQSSGAGAEFGGVTVTPIRTPAFQTITQTNGEISFTWTAMPGLNYQIQYNANLDPTNWTNLGGPFTTIVSTHSDSYVIGRVPQRFYRIVLLP